MSEETTTTVKAGSFKTRTGVLTAFDPYCHGRDVNLNDCVRGVWDAYKTRVHADVWGVRNAALTVVATGLDPEKLNFGEDVGTIYVDAATAGIYDLAGWDDREDDMSSFAEKGLCDFGVCCSSGFGDGGYGVFVARNDVGLVCGVQIVFIPAEDDVRYLADKENTETIEEEDED